MCVHRQNGINHTNFYRPKKKSPKWFVSCFPRGLCKCANITLVMDKKTPTLRWIRLPVNFDLYLFFSLNFSKLRRSNYTIRVRIFIHLRSVFLYYIFYLYVHVKPHPICTHTRKQKISSLFARFFSLLYCFILYQVCGS